MKRRKFLQTMTAAAGAIAGIPTVVPARALGRDGSVAPSERIALGFIGLGNRGRGILPGFLTDPVCQVVAACDVETSRRRRGKIVIEEHYASFKSSGKYAGCSAHNDFREIMARDDIDAVAVATPDQWHVLLSLAASRSGKDVYLEKPLGLSMRANQALRREIKTRGTVFQFGTQQRSDYKFRRACELAMNGRIGRLETLRVWSPVSRSGGSLEVVPVPEGLDYDMWVGPAPFSPYTKDRCSNSVGNDPNIGGPAKIWPFISDYCLGWIAGWGVHPLDIALWGAGKQFQGDLEVEGTGVFPTEGVCDTAVDWDLTFQCETGVRLEFKGAPSSGPWSKKYGMSGGHGTVFIGDEGWVAVKRGGLTAEPKSILDSTIGPNDIHLYESKNHASNFLECVKTRNKTICNIDDAMHVDTICHLANIATQNRGKLKWDAKTERFVDNRTANQRLTRAMRAPWRL